MTCDDIFAYLCELAPLELALDYDNPGFLIGDKQSEVSKVVVCLDCTTDIIDYAAKIGANLIITHHPVIFSPLKQVTLQAMDKRAFCCIKNGISVISMHTNLDSADGGVNDCLAEKIGLKNINRVECDDGFVFRTGELDNPVTAEMLASQLKETLGCSVRYTEGKNSLKRISVCGGSGANMMQAAINNGTDALVTADVKHNMFINALESGFALFDAGHYNTENTVIKPLCKKLKLKFPQIEFVIRELDIFNK